MRNCNTVFSSPPGLGGWAGLASLLLLGPLFFLAFTVLAEEPQGQAPPSQEPIGFTADFVSTLIPQAREKSIFSGRIYASPPRIRFEPYRQEGNGSYNEIHLYDFERQQMRRVFLEDKIYFEVELNETSRLKAMQDGWIPWKDLPNTKRRKIRLKEDFANDHPSVLHLLERRIEIPRAKKPNFIFQEYSLFWEATDLKGLPVRIIYLLSDRTTVVLDYKNVKLEEPDPSLFEPPKGFRNLSPF